MKAKHLALLLLVPAFAVFLMVRLSAEDLPVLSPDGSGAGEVVNPGDQPDDGTAPKGGSSKSGAPTIMSAEQGEEIAKKIDKVQEDQKKILEKLEELRKEMDFLKASVRTR